jgi:hypothetical protein
MVMRVCPPSSLSHTSRRPPGTMPLPASCAPERLPGSQARLADDAVATDGHCPRTAPQARPEGSREKLSFTHRNFASSREPLISARPASQAAGPHGHARPMREPARATRGRSAGELLLSITYLKDPRLQHMPQADRLPVPSDQPRPQRVAWRAIFLHEKPS